MTGRVVDKKRTRAARKAQEDGIKRLDKLFAVPSTIVDARGMPVTHSLNGLLMMGPPRLRVGCPPNRDQGTKARHLKRKRARAARRCNR